MQKGSSVVFISSIAGYQPPSAMAMYGVTKTALLGLTKVGVKLVPRFNIFYLMIKEHPKWCFP